LAGDLAGLHGDRVLAPLEGLSDFVEDAHSVLSKVMEPWGEHDAIPSGTAQGRWWNDTARIRLGVSEVKRA
jgi:hypothetical protein